MSHGAHSGKGGSRTTWSELRVAGQEIGRGSMEDSERQRQEISAEAFMEELCAATGGYGRFFRDLVMLYIGWWGAVVLVLLVLLDHHRCEAQLSSWAWLLYALTLVAVLAFAVLLELSMVQRLGLLKAGTLHNVLSEPRWRGPLVSTVLWKLDAFMDVGFIYMARDCGSSLWEASFAVALFGVVFMQLLLNMGFAMTDCDHELPASFGFVLLDFKLVNTAVCSILPFDPDASQLPIARPVTLRTARHLLGIEKVVSDIAQVSIQIVYLNSTRELHYFVLASVLIGLIHGTFSLSMVIREYVQDEWDAHKLGAARQLNTALLPCDSIRSLEARHPGPLLSCSEETGKQVDTKGGRLVPPKPEDIPDLL